MESLGLDSLMALELRNRLEATLDITLPAALVWAYPTISALAGALCERMGYEPSTEPPTDPRTAIVDALSEELTECRIAASNFRKGWGEPDDKRERPTAAA